MIRSICTAYNLPMHVINALDGVAEMPMSIRFFTTNMPIQGEKMEAFLSRIRRYIILDHHPIEAYNRSINIVFPSMIHIGVLFSEADITMRVANQILCSAMVYDHPTEYIEKALQNCHLTKEQNDDY